MAYLEHDHAHKRLAGITGVVLVHVALAAGLTAGLTIKDIILDPETRLDGTQILLPPLPEPSESPEPQPTPQQQDTRPFVPETAVTIPVDGPTITTGDPVIEERVDRVIESVVDTGVTVLPTPTPPLFTPRNPAPRNGPSGWVTDADYPRQALARGWEGTVRYQVDVTASGQVQQCRIVTSSGFAVLDEAACRRIERRARFRPATDRNGADVAGAYAGSVTWQIPDD